jgi:hypothetical protein
MSKLNRQSTMVLNNICEKQLNEMKRFFEFSYKSHMDLYRETKEPYLAELHTLFWNTSKHEGLICVQHFIPQHGPEAVIDHVLNMEHSLRDHVYMAHRISIPLTITVSPGITIDGLYNTYLNSHGLRRTDFHRKEPDGKLSLYAEGLQYPFPHHIVLMIAAVVNVVHTN